MNKNENAVTFCIAIQLEMYYSIYLNAGSPVQPGRKSLYKNKCRTAEEYHIGS